MLTRSETSLWNNLSTTAFKVKKHFEAYVLYTLVDECSRMVMHAQYVTHPQLAKAIARV